MNICAKCVYVIKGYGDQWYSYTCSRNPLPMSVDPVTGQTMSFTKNDLGRVVFTDQPYPYCREINTDGNCQQYEKDGV